MQRAGDDRRIWQDCDEKQDLVVYLHENNRKLWFIPFFAGFFVSRVID